MESGGVDFVNREWRSQLAEWRVAGLTHFVSGA